MEVTPLKLSVAFEGISGSGKSTAILQITKILKEEGFLVSVVHITGTREGKKIFNIAMGYPPESIIRMLLLWAARLLQEEEASFCREGDNDEDIVILDRSFATMEVCDGYENKAVNFFLKWLKGFIREPDITFFLDVPLKVARKRKKSKSLEDDLISKKIIQAYRKICNKRKKWIWVDGTRSKENIISECVKEINVWMDKSA